MGDLDEFIEATPKADCPDCHGTGEIGDLPDLRIPSVGCDCSERSPRRTSGGYPSSGRNVHDLPAPPNTLPPGAKEHP